MLYNLLSIMSQTIIGNNILPSEMSSVELLYGLL